MSALINFFQDCIDSDHREKDYYLGLMETYYDEAKKKIGDNCEFVGYAFTEGLKSAKELFDKLGLRRIHGYALISHLNDFIMEFDEYESNASSQYD